MDDRRPFNESYCVLLVESDAIVRNILSVFLTAYGYFVITAASTAERETLIREYAGKVAVIVGRSGGAARKPETGTPASAVATTIRFTDDIVEEIAGAGKRAGWSFRSKPLVPEHLAARILDLVRDVPAVEPSPVTASWD